MKTKSSYNREVLEIIVERHGYSFDYIRKSIRGDRVGIIPDILKNEYNKLISEARKAVATKVSTL
jgi:hypothetical protein